MAWFQPADAGELAAILESRAVDPGSADLPQLIATGASDVRPDLAEVLRAEDADVVSTAALDDVIDHEPADLSITVGAGMRLERLSASLAERGQWFPPVCSGHAGSVGGLVASAPIGLFDPSHGTVARHVLACRALDAAGRSYRWGRAVMKDVAGYDVKGLWCGSHGRLGVLTEVSLRVWAEPPARLVLAVEATTDETITLCAAAASWTPEESPRPDALVWRWRTGQDRARLEARFVGSEPSVAERRARFESWGAAQGATLAETDPAGELRMRDPARVRIRSTGHRGAIGTTIEGIRGALSRVEAAGEITAFPQLGIVIVEYERPHEPVAAVTLWEEMRAAGSGGLRVERGGAEEIASVDRARPDGLRALEERVVEALGGGPRHWASDHL